MTRGLRKAKVKKIVLDGYGSFLGMEKGCYIVRNKNKKHTRSLKERAKEAVSN